MNVFLIFRSAANNHFQYGNDNGKQCGSPAWFSVIPAPKR
jgi:hypothetical protein